MSKSTLSQPAELSEVRSMSKRIGTDLSLVQGSGGNTSVKDGRVLWVKASGTWLSEAEDKNILVPVELEKVRSILETGESDFSQATMAGDLRPSIETSLHCLLPHHVVVHVHSVSGIAWSVQNNSRDRLDDLFAQMNWRYVPYAKPGTSLTSAVFDILSNSSETPDFLVLENHGLVVGGESCQAVEQLLADVERRLILRPRRIVGSADISSLEMALTDLQDWRLPETEDIHNIALDDETISISIGGALIPDHAVFLEKPVPVSEVSETISETMKKYWTTFGNEPDWIIVRGKGVILSSRLREAGEAQLRGLAAVALRIPQGASIRYIDGNAAEELRNWDAEIYRKQLDDERS